MSMKWSIIPKIGAFSKKLIPEFYFFFVRHKHRISAFWYSRHLDLPFKFMKFYRKIPLAERYFGRDQDRA